MPVRAFLFDFDGLIIDTETASRAGWAWLYREHGFELPEEKWATLIGTIGAPWEPMRHLEELVGTPLDADALNERRRAHELSLLETEEFRPGILEYLDEATERGLRTAIVSSSSNRWIDMHLSRLEHAHRWDAIVAANHDVARAKPRPDLYLEACGLIGVEPAEAIAFEDSPNGVRAARAAGIFCVAVPNDVTRDLGLEEADLLLDSLADLLPAELLSRFE